MFEKCGRWLDRNKEALVLVISAILLVFALDLFKLAFDDKARWYWRAGSGVLLLATVASCWYGTKAQRHLTAENARLRDQVESDAQLIESFGSDYFETWENFLRNLSESLNFDARDRISVYRHDGSAFTMVGRFAVLPELQKPGRGVYPVDQGVIGAAWKSGEGQHVVQDLPDPITHLEAYCTRSKDDWNLPIGTTKKLTMKPRSVAAFALNNAKNSSRDVIIVFESTDENRFDVTRIESALKGSDGKNIVHLLELMRKREPSLPFAALRGF